MVALAIALAISGAGLWFGTVRSVDPAEADAVRRVGVGRVAAAGPESDAASGVVAVHIHHADDRGRGATGAVGRYAERRAVTAGAGERVGHDKRVLARAEAGLVFLAGHEAAAADGGPGVGEPRVCWQESTPRVCCKIKT